MRLIVERVLLVFPHQRALFRRIGLVQHLLVEIDRLPVLEPAVLLGEYAGRLVFADIEHRVDDALAVAFETDIELAAAQHHGAPVDRADEVERHVADGLALLVDPRGEVAVWVARAGEEPAPAAVVRPPHAPPPRHPGVPRNR